MLVRNPTLANLGDGESSCAFVSYLGPWRVELCICEDMNAGGDLSDKAVAVVNWSVGDIKHGFRGNVGDYQVETVVLVRFLFDFFGEVEGSCLALSRQKHRRIIIL